jgi:hypothetical protein
MVVLVRQYGTRQFHPVTVAKDHLWNVQVRLYRVNQCLDGNIDGGSVRNRLDCAYETLVRVIGTQGEFIWQPWSLYYFSRCSPDATTHLRYVDQVR